jgi:hypothetical protein
VSLDKKMLANQVAYVAHCDHITITSPAPGMLVSSPVTVAGKGKGAESTLVVRILDGTGFEIGLRVARLVQANGSGASYQVAVPYQVPSADQPGRIQVYSESQEDGSIEHLASVVVTLQGNGLNETIRDLKSALEMADWPSLAELMAERWLVGVSGEEPSQLSRQESRELINRGLGKPGDVLVNLSVDAQAMLAENGMDDPRIAHAVYTSGWHFGQVTEGLLLLTLDPNQRIRWGGLLLLLPGHRTRGMSKLAITGKP